GEMRGVLRTLDAVAAQSSAIEDITVALEASEDIPAWTRRQIDIRWMVAASGDSMGRRYNQAVSFAGGAWVWLMPSGSEPVPGTLDLLAEGIPSGADAVHMSDREGELTEAFGGLLVEPTVDPARVLWKRSLAEGKAFDEAYLADPFWGFVLERMGDASWAEAVAGEEQGISGTDTEPLGRMADHIADRFLFYRRYAVDTPEMEIKRIEAVKRARRLAQSAFQREHRPMASIVIPHYNLPDKLEKAINALIENTSDIPFEIIVVDNGSENTTDALVASLESKGVLLLRNRRNEGFARACNRGARAAKGHYVVMLNNDTQVQHGWLTELVHTAQEEPLAGVVGSKLLFPDGTVQHAGIVMNEDGMPGLVFGKMSADTPGTNERTPYQAVTAACCLIRKDLFDRLGGFDIGYMNGWEDVDFCLSARRKGWRIYFEPNSVVIHDTSATPGRKDHEGRNQRRFHQKWGDKVQPDEQLYSKHFGYDGEVTVKDDPATGTRVRSVGRAPKPQPSEKEPVGSAHSSQAAPTNGSTPSNGTGGAMANGHDLANLLARADSLIKDGEFETAESELLGGQKMVNGNMRTRSMYWTLLGDARFRQDRGEEAYNCYQKAVTDDPSAERAWIGIGAYHLVSDDVDKAEDIFSKVVKLSPDNARGHLGLGNVQLKRNNFEAALGHFQEAARLTPDKRPVIVGLVAAAVQSAKMEAARTPLENYLDHHPEDHEARFHLAAICFGIEDLVAARREALTVLEAVPDHKGATELMSHLKDKAVS
ncbi:glycosyltransferase, partial [bacterium]|nr:glycosyltransferase [bacterium]